MDHSRLKKNWDEITSTNRFNRYVMLLLSVALMVTSVGWLQTRETVVLVPPQLDEKVWVSSNDSAPGYKKAWALSVAQLMGNVSPGNADFIVDVMGSMLEPLAYRRIKEELTQQAEDIKEGSLVVTFEPQSLLHEEETDKVFVYGMTTVQGPNKVEEVIHRTFEFSVNIAFGSPRISFFDVYEGQPKTQKYLQANQGAHNNG